MEPQTNAEGIHVWPFDLAFPVDVRFFRFARGHHIRMTRHDYFELLYVDFGEVVYQIQNRFFTMRCQPTFRSGSTNSGFRSAVISYNG